MMDNFNVDFNESGCYSNGGNEYSPKPCSWWSNQDDYVESKSLKQEEWDDDDILDAFD